MNIDVYHQANNEERQEASPIQFAITVGSIHRLTIVNSSCLSVSVLMLILKNHRNVAHMGQILVRYCIIFHPTDVCVPREHIAH